MPSTQVEERLKRFENTELVARQTLEAERAAREEKTARLRAMREQAMREKAQAEADRKGR